jgi:intracellular multiplication protein IcmP
MSLFSCIAVQSPIEDGLMAAQQQQSSSDSGMGPVWIIVSLFFIGWLVWRGAHQYIVNVVFFIDIWQAKLVHLFTGSPLLANEINIMQTANPINIDWNEMIRLTRSVGEYSRYPIILILSILGVWLYQSDITLKFRRAHNMKSLVQQEQLNWPAIMPVIGKDLVAMDINVGPWAMAMTPIEFSRKYNLLKKEDALLDKSQPGQEMTAGVRRGDAKRVFTLQLGPYWDGFERCPPHARVLAAACMARMNRDRDSAKHILETMDKGSATGKMDYSVANATIQKHQNAANVQEVLAGHAYLMTVMASLLKASRDDGVFASCDFLWLKTIDRRLWYMLNCVGRQTPYAEVAGPFAHWKAEQVMGRRLLVPMIDEAIRALEVAVKEVKLSPKEMQELRP